MSNQEKQIKIQINQRMDGRFNSTINLLGSNETSACTGTIYVLCKLAKEEKEYRKQVVQVLCPHIISKTQEKTNKINIPIEHNKKTVNQIKYKP